MCTKQTNKKKSSAQWRSCFHLRSRSKVSELRNGGSNALPNQRRTSESSEARNMRQTSCIETFLKVFLNSASFSEDVGVLQKKTSHPPSSMEWVMTDFLFLFWESNSSGGGAPALGSIDWNQTVKASVCALPSSGPGGAPSSWNLFIDPARRLAASSDKMRVLRRTSPSTLHSRNSFTAPPPQQGEHQSGGLSLWHFSQITKCTLGWATES